MSSDRPAVTRQSPLAVVTALAAAPPGTAASALWRSAAVCATAVLMFILPSRVVFGWPIWKLQATAQVQASWGVLAFLLGAAVTAFVPRPRALVARVLVLTAAMGSAFVLTGVILRITPSLPQSGKALLVALAAAALFALADALIGVWRAWIVLLLSLIAALVVREGQQLSSSEDFVHEAQQLSLSVHVTHVDSLAAPLAVEGGGLAFEPTIGTLLVTGSGRFGLISLDADTRAVVRPVNAADPRNAGVFAREVGVPVNLDWFRVGDVAMRRAGDSVEVFVLHHFWRSDSRCLVARVSRAMADSALSSVSPWTPVFEGQPCLRITTASRGLPFVGSQIGGRLLWVPEGLMVSLGDHQFDGLNRPTVLSQDSTSHYGKIVLLPNGTGAPRIWSLGHRNPQGLARDSSGHIWSTEHGPRGGDELNLIEPGVNYGWPWRTEGSDYGLRTWPLQRAASSAFREPAFAWIPSIGVSALVVPSPTRFAPWKDDLLVGALKAKSLYRVHLDGTRPMYVEHITLGYEVRDMETATDGTIMIWTDEGVVLTMVPVDPAKSGVAAIEQCVACHSVGEGQYGGLAPNLRGVVGRKVASQAGFPYSQALRSVGGKWSRDRLDAFLTNPAAFAPGTAMSMGGIADSAVRRRIIDYLQSVEYIMPH